MPRDLDALLSGRWSMLPLYLWDREVGRRKTLFSLESGSDWAGLSNEEAVSMFFCVPHTSTPAPVCSCLACSLGTLNSEQTKRCLQLSWICPDAPDSAAADNHRAQRLPRAAQVPWGSPLFGGSVWCQHPLLTCPWTLTTSHFFMGKLVSDLHRYCLFPECSFFPSERSSLSSGPVNTNNGELPLVLFHSLFLLPGTTRVPPVL